MAQALQIHTYVSMSAVAQSVTSDAITLGNFAQSKVHLALKSSLAKGSVGSFARGLRSLGGKIMWLGPLFDVADIALSSTEYYLAKNEAQARIFRTEIIFGSISLGLSLGFIVASVLGATLLSTLLLPIGLLLAGLRYLVVSQLEAADTDREKAKIINDYFQQMQDGWNNAGFKLENGVLLPYQGVVDLLPNSKISVLVLVIN
ncbi:TcdA/TcdB pore-forming domain-containing protein [Candidatus Regiella insecticola]|uniref:TcdA/TcdB pore-forming domain-containing protein n=1 Tax=Candidatus Regiella insecticola TaxID=138073 RepID=UPI0015968C3E|nr:TcdA/TcdB pore-forming domain-containing protein [Candidatus Regiella insecticola]